MNASLRVVDTSAWVEWFGQSELGKRLDHDFPALEDCIVPTIVLYELGVWSQRNQLAGAHDRLMSMVELCRSDVFDRGTALAAIEMNLDRRLPMADRIIYATARKHGVDVLTCDAHFEGLPNVVFHRKVGLPVAGELRGGYARSHLLMASTPFRGLM